MKGLALARSYYEEVGRPMLEREFSAELNRIAVGLAGHGSECFGFDDTVSQDHDFAPGFCLWLDEKDEREFGFRLFRAYGRLPQEYRGYKLNTKSVGGADGKGVHTIGDFYSFYIGSPGVPESLEQWMAIPDFYLAEATNGEVFSDPLGKFTAIREKLLNDRPEDVRIKKLAAAVFDMAQAGQYNYSRCLSHGEKPAAAVALSNFAQSTAQAVYLLNKRYAPYYKWIFRGLKTLPELSETGILLEQLLSAPYEKDKNTELIEKISFLVAEQMRKQQLVSCTDAYLEPYAYELTNRIQDGNLRNSPIIL